MTDQTGQGGYGSMPSAPPPAQPQRGAAPSSVLNAQKLMFLRAALGLLGIITLFATKSTLKSQILKNNPNYDTSKLDSAVNAAVTIGLIVGLVFLVLYVLLALQVGKGKNWPGS